MRKPLDIVFLGLTLSSSWGNGHATTYRALLRGLAAGGHRVLFLERDVPWYADHRDLADPDFCTLSYYKDLAGLRRHLPVIASADAVIIGSYVPEGVAIIDLIAGSAPPLFCFYDIDTPVTLAGLESGETEFLAPRQVPMFDIYFSFAGGTALDRLKTRYGARRAVPLYCSVDETQHFHTAEPPKWDLGYLGTYSKDRQPALERLLLEPARRLPDRSFVVAGAQYPDDIDWPDNVERLEHVPPTAHASFYSRQRYTLNLTRTDMVSSGWSPSVRLFEAGACGTPVISDRWNGLSQLFPENEAVLIADTNDDVVRILTTLPERERLRVARGARTRVLAGHTGKARAEELIRYLAECSERGRPVRPAVAV